MVSSEQSSVRGTRGNYRYDNVTLIPLVLQLGLRIGAIQRMRGYVCYEYTE
jgi:hypothetical protein